MSRSQHRRPASVSPAAPAHVVPEPSAGCLPVTTEQDEAQGDIASRPCPLAQAARPLLWSCPVPQGPCAQLSPHSPLTDTESEAGQSKDTGARLHVTVSLRPPPQQPLLARPQDRALGSTLASDPLHWPFRPDGETEARGLPGPQRRKQKGQNLTPSGCFPRGLSPQPLPLGSPQSP